MSNPVFFSAKILVLLLFAYITPQLSAQCDSLSLEIPNNGIDEDCDGLDELYLNLPPYIYILEDQPFELYYRNVFVSQHPEDYSFEISTPLIGTTLHDRWQFTPNINDAGEHPLLMSIRTSDGTLLTEATSTFRIIPEFTADITSEKSAFLLGHSFIDQGYMPAYINNLTELPGNPTVTYHGSRASWIDNTRHEALGGASWEFYYNNPESPFMFDSVFDIRAYFDTFLCKSCTPDWFVIHLDVNDFCFPGIISGNDIDSIDAYIDLSYSSFIDPFMQALSTTAPETKIAISYTPPPNGRDTTFRNFFGAASVLSDRYRWQKIVSRTTYKYTQFFQNREDENIYLIPIHLGVDDISDFSPIDPVHPHPDPSTLDPPSGYLDIAEATFAWMKYTINGTVSTTPSQSISPAYVWPNPVKNDLYFSTNMHDIQWVEIVSMNGNRVLQNTVKEGQKSINIENLPAGSYFLRLVTASDGLHIAKFIKF